jgi:CrcB protein
MSGQSPTAPGTALVAVGGFGGALSRYAVEVALPSALAATLAVNVLGSFALGVLFFANRRGDLVDERTMLVAATGFLSSFTTYSTFVLDTAAAAPVVAGAYVAGSYALGFGAAVLGRRGSRRLVARMTTLDHGGDR